MKTLRLTLSAAILAVSATWAAAEVSRQINWNELVPEAPVYDDPFIDMPYEQLSDLAKIYGIEYLPEEDRSPEQKAERLRLREKLTEQGLDLDYLFQQRLVVIEAREKHAMQTNDAVLGQSVSLPGYILPLEFDGRKTVEFLLVPTVGACVHTPPPPANQVVLVRYDEGFETEGLFAPVWISGVLNGQSASRAVGYSDGQGDVQISYTMNAVLVQPY